MDELEEWEAAARRTIGVIDQTLAHLGFNAVDLTGPGLIGLGRAVGWPDDKYCMISVGLGGSETMVNVVNGVLRDIRQDRMPALEACNRLTRDNSTFPCVLHDAEAGWDILLSQRLPISVFALDPDFLKTCLEAQLMIADSIREDLEIVSLGGNRYRWNDDDVNRLLIRSLL